MSASRASQELAQKTNVNPSLNRQTEATAADFIEIGEIFDDHANRLDELQNELYHADFVGYYGSLALLQATYPTAPDNAFAIIVNGSNVPQQIYQWNDAWTLIQGTDALVSFNSYSQFPNPGVLDTLYFAKDTRKLYLWYNSQYVCINERGNTFSYAKHDFILTDLIENVSFGDANFYLIEADNEVIPYHFAIKNELSERFTNFGVKLANTNDVRHDLTAPDYVQDGYHIWKLPNISTYNDVQNNPFQVWFFGGDNKQDRSPVDGKRYNLLNGGLVEVYKKKYLTINAQNEIELNNPEGNIYNIDSPTSEISFNIAGNIREDAWAVIHVNADTSQQPETVSVDEPLIRFEGETYNWRDNEDMEITVEGLPNNNYRWWYYTRIRR